MSGRTTASIVADLREWIWDETDEAYGSLMEAADRLAELQAEVDRLSNELFNARLTLVAAEGEIESLKAISGRSGIR